MPGSFNITVDQGDSLPLVVGPVKVPDPVTGVESPIDLTQGGMKMWVTAKATLDVADSAAPIRKRTVSAGGASGEIDLNVPVTTDKNYATANITAAEIAAITAPVFLKCDVQLEEPNGRKTTIARGVIAVRADVTDA